MARKTAMGKEPGTVSIAVPQSEKDRMRTGGRNLPGKPPSMDDKGNLTGKQSLERVSPGVYRNSQGKLVGSKGQALPKRSPIQSALQGASQAAGMQPGAQGGMQGGIAAGVMPNMQPAGRPGQQLSQDEMNAAMQARDLVSQYENMQGSVDDIMRNRFGQNQQFVPYPSQIQPGYRQAPPGQAPMMMQDLMYRYPPGTQMPNLYEAMQRAPQVQQQPNTISGLLRRGR